MKTFTDHAISVQEITDVCCNECGRAVEKNAFGYFEDYISLEKNWGYHSPYDGESHSIDLCLDCYNGWISKFQIPPDIISGNFAWL